MALDTILNVVWAAIGVFALSLLAVSERRQGRSGLARIQRLVAVLLFTVSLFPCVSLSDDLFSLSFLQSNPGRHGGVGTPLPQDSKEKSNLHLFRVLQSLDSQQVTAAYTVSITLCFFALVLLVAKRTANRDSLCRSGRAPPIVFSAA